MKIKEPVKWGVLVFLLLSLAGGFVDPLSVVPVLVELVHEADVN